LIRDEIKWNVKHTIFDRIFVWVCGRTDVMTDGQHRWKEKQTLGMCLAFLFYGMYFYVLFILQ